MKSKIENFFHIIVQVYNVLDQGQKRGLVLVFFFMVVSAALEVMGIAVITPFISVVIDYNSLMENAFLYNLIVRLNINSKNQVVLFICVMFILLYLIKNLVLLVARYIQNLYQCKVQQQLSTRMLKFYMQKPYEFFTNNNSAKIYRGIHEDVIGFYETLRNLLVLLVESLSLSLIFLYIMVLNSGMAIGIILIASMCILIVVLGCKDMIKKAGVKCREADIEKTKRAYQAINGIKEISVTQRKDFFEKMYDLVYIEYRKVRVHYLFVNSIPERVFELSFVVGIAILVCIQVILGRNAEKYISQMAAIAVACFRLLPSMGKITTAINGTIYQSSSVDNVYQNILEIKKMKNIRKEVEKAEKTAERDFGVIDFEKELTIDHISWHYDNNQNILEDVSLNIKKGESIALIGESGAGKSTLADIILGLLHPQHGKILVDGMDISMIKSQWANLVGFVPQSVYLIDDTIRNNVAFGIEPEYIEDKSVWQALDEAQLGSFVRQLPSGLDTIVGERGIKFSGGQRQRIAIARALYNNPEILVLDEATSALDNETEKAVMESINSLMGIKTLIIVAHRLTTIRNCDKIYEVKDGKVIRKAKEILFLD